MLRPLIEKWLVEDPDHRGRSKYTIEDVVQDLVEGRMSKSITDEMVRDAYQKAEELMDENQNGKLDL